MFYTNSLPSRLSAVQESSCQVSCCFRVFYLVLTVSGEFQHGWVVGTEDGQDGGFKFLQRKT